MGAFSSKAKCKGCGAVLRQNVKWDWIGSGVISFFVVFPIFLVCLGQLPCIAALVIVVAVLLLAFVLFPYISKYEMAPKHDKSNSTGEAKE
jgi:hypothetical protein